MKKLLCGLLCLLASALPGAQQAENPLLRQSSNIKERLESLKRQSGELTLLCRTLQEDLEKSRAEASEWRTKSTELSESLTAINGELNSCYENIADLEAKTRTLWKAVIALLAGLALLSAIKVGGYILYFRGVRVPRWLDILI